MALALRWLLNAALQASQAGLRQKLRFLLAIWAECPYKSPRASGYYR